MTKTKYETDVNRWSDLKNYNSVWNDRTECMAKMIPFDAKTLLEFGAGTRFLETVLPEGVSYTPSDLVSRGDDTIVCDLNKLPYNITDKTFDVVFLSGVLEYVVNLNKFINYLAELSDAYVVCSYTTVRGKSERNGWTKIIPMNDLVAMFVAAGFEVVTETTWGNHRLFMFVKVDRR